MGGAEGPSHAAPSTGPGRLSLVVIAGAVDAITLPAALRRKARSRRCTIECCLSPNVTESIAARRWTMESAVNCGSAASQPSIAGKCGSSLDGMRIRFL